MAYESKFLSRAGRYNRYGNAAYQEMVAGSTQLSPLSRIRSLVRDRKEEELSQKAQPSIKYATLSPERAESIGPDTLGFGRFQMEQAMQPDKKSVFKPPSLVTEYKSGTRESALNSVRNVMRSIAPTETPTGFQSVLGGLAPKSFQKMSSAPTDSTLSRMRKVLDANPQLVAPEPKYNRITLFDKTKVTMPRRLEVPGAPGVTIPIPTNEKELPKYDSASYFVEKIKGGIIDWLVGISRASTIGKPLDTGKAFFKDIAQQKQEFAQTEEENLSKTKYTLGRFAESVAQMVPSILIGATTGLGAGTAARALPYLLRILPQPAMGAFGVAAMGNYAAQAEAEGQDKATADLYGFLAGLGEMASENVFGAIPFMGGAFKTSLDSVKKLTQNKLAQFTLSMLINGVEEGLEEPLADVFEMFSRRLTYEPEGKLSSAEQLFQDFIGGVAMSAVLGFGATLADVQGYNVEDIVSGRNFRSTDENVAVYREAVAMLSPEEKSRHAEVVASATKERMTQEEKEAFIRSANEVLAEEIVNRGETVKKTNEPISKEPIEDNLEPYVPEPLVESKDRDIIALSLLRQNTQIVRNMGLPSYEMSLVEDIQQNHNEKKISDFMAGFGRKVYFYEEKNNIGDGLDPRVQKGQQVSIGGFVATEDHPDILFIKRGKQAAGMTWVAGHEFGHTLKTTQPALYAETIEYLRKTLTEKERATFLSQYKGLPGVYDEYSTDENKFLDEFFADQAGNLMTSKTFWSQLRETSVELFERIANAVINFINSVGSVTYKWFETKSSALEFSNRVRNIIVEERKAVVQGKQQVAEAQAKPEVQQSFKTPQDIVPWAEPQQEISSAKTSINAQKLPATFGRVQFEKGTINADIGGGRFDNVTEFLSSKGVLNVVYDPYNRSAENNKKAIETVRGGRADTATVNNVLNVIREPNSRKQVIANAADAIKQDGKAYFLIHEGNGTGEGKTTTAGWQENRKAKTYIDEISNYFGNVVQKGNLLIATNPIKIQQSFKTPQDYKSAEEKRALQMGVGREAAAGARKRAEASADKVARQQFDAQAKQVRSLYRERDALEQAIGRLMEKNDAASKAQAKTYQKRLDAMKEKIKKARAEVKVGALRLMWSDAISNAKKGLSENVNAVYQLTHKPSYARHVSPEMSGLFTAVGAQLEKARRNYAGEPVLDTKDILKEYSDLHKQGKYDTVDAMENIISELDGIDIRRPSVGDLTMLNSLVGHLRSLNDNANRAIDKALKVTFDEGAKRIIEEAAVAENKAHGVRGLFGNLLFQTKNILDKIEYIGGNKGDGSFTNLLSERIRQSFLSYVDMNKEDTEFIRDLLAPYSKLVPTWTGTSAKNFIFETDRGEKTEVTAAELMYLYIAKNRPKLKKRLETAGFMIDMDSAFRRGKHDVSDKTSYILTESDFNNIDNALTKEQKQVADKILEWYNTVSKKRVDDTHMALHGFKITEDGPYVPAKVKKELADSRPMLSDSFSAWDMDNLGILQEMKTGSQQPVLLLDVFDSRYNHATATERYAAYGVIARDVLHMFRTGRTPSTNVWMTVEDKIGKGGKESLEQDFQNVFFGATPERQNVVLRLFNWLLSQYKKARVSGPITALIQPTALPRFYTDIGFKYMAAIADPRWSGSMETLKESSKIAWVRTNIAFNRELSDTRAAFDARGKLKVPWQFRGMQYMDNKWTMIPAWKSMQAYTHEKNPELKIGSKEFFAKAGELFDRRFPETQLVNDVVYSGEAFERRDMATRSILAFQSEKFKAINLLHKKLLEGKTTGDYKPAARAFAAMFFNAFAMMAVGIGKGLLRRPEDEKKEMKNVPEYVFKQSMAMASDMVPLLENLTNIIVDNMKPERMDLRSVYEASQSVVQAGMAVLDIFKPPEERTSRFSLWGGAFDLAKSASQIFGVPVKVIWTDVEGSLRMIGGKYYALWLIENYNPAQSTSKKLYYDTIYSMLKKGDKEAANDLIDRMKEAGISSQNIADAIKSRSKN